MFYTTTKCRPSTALVNASRRLNRHCMCLSFYTKRQRHFLFRCEWWLSTKVQSKIRPYVYVNIWSTWSYLKVQCLKNTKTTAILQNTANFKLFFFCLKSRNFYTKYNFLIAFIWYAAQFLTFSISTKNSEKLNQIGFNFPLTYVQVYLQSRQCRTQGLLVPRAFLGLTRGIWKGPGHINMRNETAWLIYNTLDSCSKQVFFARPVYFRTRVRSILRKNLRKLPQFWINIGGGRVKSLYW